MPDNGYPNLISPPHYEHFDRESYVCAYRWFNSVFTRWLGYSDEVGHGMSCASGRSCDECACNGKTYV